MMYGAAHMLTQVGVFAFQQTVEFVTGVPYWILHANTDSLLVSLMGKLQ